MFQSRLASYLPSRPLRQLARRLRPRPDLDSEETGPSPQTVTPAERVELSQAKPYRSVPGPWSWPLVGSVEVFLGSDPQRLDRIFQRLRARYGDVYKFTHPLRNMETVVTFRPQDIEKVFRSEGVWPIRPGLYPVRQYNIAHGLHQGLFPSNGSDWNEMRSVTQQLLLRADSMRPYIAHMDSAAEHLVNTLACDRDPHGRLRTDFLQHAYKAAFDVVHKINHGSDAWANWEDLVKIVRHARDFFNLIGELEFHINTWRYLATPKWRRFNKVMDFYADMAKRWTAQALQSSSSTEPRLLAALHERGFTPQMVQAFALDLLIAAVDTTGLSFQYLMYNLATNPACQERAFQEVQQLPPLGHALNYQHLNTLPYLRACVKESLRLDAPLLGTARKLGKDTVIGGYRIPKGTVVFVPLHMMARDGAEFPAADQFQPERWSRDTDQQPPQQQHGHGCPVSSPFANLPFSHGRRMCIGRRLAETELLVFAARLLQRFQLEYHGQPLSILTQIVCIPEAKLPFTLKDRQQRRGRSAPATQPGQNSTQTGQNSVETGGEERSTAAVIAS